VALAIVVICLGVAVGIWGARQGGSPASTTAAAKSGTVREMVATQATVDDVSEADVNSDLSGDIGSLDVGIGDEVFADETLAETDFSSDDATLYEESLALGDDESQLSSDESNQSLQSANAEVATVQEEVTTDQANAAQAQTGVATVQMQNEATLAQDEPAVSQAETTWSTDNESLTTDQSTLSKDQDALESAQEQFSEAGCPTPPSGSTADCTSLAGAVTHAQAAVASDQATESKDQSAVETDQQSVQDDQTTLLIDGLNDQTSLTQAASKLTTAQLALSIAEAALASAQAAVSQSQREVDIVTEVDAQKVTQLEAQVQSQKDDLRNNRLTAPITGTVKSVQIKPGMAVNSAPSELTVGSKPSTAAIVIDSHGSLVAETKVDGSAAADIRVGDPVELTTARDHAAVRGTVSSVGIASTDQSGKETVPVTVMIPKDPAGLSPGLTAEAHITLLKKDHAVTVPSAAIHTSGGRTFVDELVNGRSVSHDVRVGIVGNGVTQIVSGISDGTKVVVPN
jgi:multidrug efflux pump subunit AcrA (membrane-fusion protein)